MPARKLADLLFTVRRVPVAPACLGPGPAKACLNRASGLAHGSWNVRLEDGGAGTPNLQGAVTRDQVTLCDCVLNVIMHMAGLSTKVLKLILYITYTL